MKGAAESLNASATPFEGGHQEKLQPNSKPYHHLKAAVASQKERESGLFCQASFVLCPKVSSYSASVDEQAKLADKVAPLASAYAPCAPSAQFQGRALFLYGRKLFCSTWKIPCSSVAGFAGFAGNFVIVSGRPAIALSSKEA